MKIGEKIAQLRREKGATQEEIGSAVGVSAQAVSKWETGGTPDVELLPAIADCFGVSTDELFSRETPRRGDIYCDIARHIGGEAREDRFYEAYKTAWAIQMGLAGKGDVPPLEGFTSEMSNSWMLFDGGISMLRLSGVTPYFFVAPSIGSGYAPLVEGDKPELLRAFFAFLADRDALRALILLYSRAANTSFTTALLEKQLDIPREKAQEILDSLEKYRFLMKNQLELNDEIVMTYEFVPNPAFVPLLMFARDVAEKPDIFKYYYGNRQSPYLRT